MKPFRLLYKIPAGYGLHKATCYLVMSLETGEIFTIEMKVNCWEGVTSRHSLLMDMEEHCKKISTLHRLRNNTYVAPEASIPSYSNAI